MNDGRGTLTQSSCSKVEETQIRILIRGDFTFLKIGNYNNLKQKPSSGQTNPATFTKSESHSRID